MGREARPDDEADFDALATYLRGELERLNADERAIRLRSSRSFASWAENVLGAFAEATGVTVGFLLGQVAAVYDTVAEGWTRGWRRGIERGRHGRAR